MMRHTEKYAEQPSILELPAVFNIQTYQQHLFNCERNNKKPIAPIDDWLESIIVAIPPHPCICKYVSRWIKSAQSLEMHHTNRAISIMYAEYGTHERVIFVKLGNYQYDYNISNDYFIESQKPRIPVSRVTMQQLIIAYLQNNYA
jgi:hypothetical protein